MPTYLVGESNGPTRFIGEEAVARQNEYHPDRLKITRKIGLQINDSFAHS